MFLESAKLNTLKTTMLIDLQTDREPQIQLYMLTFIVQGVGLGWTT